MPERQQQRATELQLEADLLRARRAEDDEVRADERKGQKPRDRVWSLLIGLGIIVAILGLITIDTHQTAEANLKQSRANAVNGNRTRALNCTLIQSLQGDEAMREAREVAEICFNDEGVQEFYDPTAIRNPSARFCGLLDDLRVAAPGCEEEGS